LITASVSGKGRRESWIEINESKLPDSKVFVEEMRTSSVGVTWGYIGTNVSLTEGAVGEELQAEVSRANEVQTANSRVKRVNRAILI
jgi:hypothetical protein